MAEENISQEFRLKNVDETRNYLIEEINRHELISKKHKNVCTTLNYIDHFLILASAVTGCVSISAFFVSISAISAFIFVGISVGITSSAFGLKICTITAGINKYKSILRKKIKKHYEIVLLAKSKLNSIEILIFKALIDSVISHDEFILIINVLKECNELREEIKNLRT